MSLVRTHTRNSRDPQAAMKSAASNDMAAGAAAQAGSVQPWRATLQMSASIRLNLALPPSVNGIWRAVASKAGKVRLHRSQDYREWQSRAGWELKAQRQRPVAGGYALAMRVPLDMPGDLDNRLKGLSDLLVSHGLIDSDKLAQRIVIARAADVPAGRCIVQVEPCPVSATPSRPGVAAARGRAAVPPLPGPFGGAAEASPP